MIRLLFIAGHINKRHMRLRLHIVYDVVRANRETSLRLRFIAKCIIANPIKDQVQN